MGSYQQALEQLSQAPLANFLAERKRLAAELRAQGDAAGAGQIEKRSKPVASVWAVNQLYWRERDAFDAMLDTAGRIRAGDLRAAKAHHDALATLRRRAAAMLQEAGYAASDATLRRVASTLAAIAAAGGFAPDPPGGLMADRDPPGFDAISSMPAAATAASRRTGGSGRTALQHRRAARTDAASASQQDARRQAAEAAERRQQQAERVRRRAERARLQLALRGATADLRSRERASTQLEEQIRAAKKTAAHARELVRELERKLAALDDVD